MPLVRFAFSGEGKGGEPCRACERERRGGIERKQGNSIRPACAPLGSCVRPTECARPMGSCVARLRGCVRTSTWCK
jgi:hypothetical protein